MVVKAILVRWALVSLLWTLILTSLPVGVAATKGPVLIGLDAEFSWPGSTSAQAIEQGILIAIDEINRSGGVLGGRPLELVKKDNGTIPARSIRNLREFAQATDLVAVFCGRFSPTVIEALETVHALPLILLDPWAAADLSTAW